jgi:hypothetical protein
MEVATLLDRIANPPTLKESTLDERGIQGVLEDAFIKMTAKVQSYVDKSIELRRIYRKKFGGLPPTELDPSLQPNTSRTAAIDQQRQLYAGSRVALVNPRYGDNMIDHLVEWHDAFVKNFVKQTDQGPVVYGAVEFAPDGALTKQIPDLKASIRFTYAVEGSATLARALVQAAERNSDKHRKYLQKANDIRDLVLSIGETFQKQFADPSVPGRYFFLEGGRVPRGNPAEIEGLSHNNSQSYLIKGLETLAALDKSGTWANRLNEMLRYIQTQRDALSGLLREFDFKGGSWNPSVIDRTTDELNLKWQSQNGYETVILGHTVAGLWEAPANLAARGRRQELEFLVADFVASMNTLNGIHANGLPANAFELHPTEIRQKDWPEAGWQAELIWQFLLHALEGGIELSEYKVKAGETEISLDRLLARGLELHDATIFDGISYVTQYGQNLKGFGRQFAAPINHAAETVEALERALAALPLRR